jgi:hypothetical protein
VTDNRINIMRLIAKYVDAIYLRKATRDDTSHISNAAHNLVKTTRITLRSSNLTKLEKHVFDNLDRVYQNVTTNTLSRYTDLANLESLVHMSEPTLSIIVNPIIKYLKSTLAIVGVLDYSDTNIVLPRIHITPKDELGINHCNRTLFTTEYSMTTNSSYNSIYAKIIIPGEIVTHTHLIDLCSLVAISSPPCIGSVSLSEYLSSQVVRRYVYLTRYAVVDTEQILEYLSINNNNVITLEEILHNVKSDSFVKTIGTFEELDDDTTDNPDEDQVDPDDDSGDNPDEDTTDNPQDDQADPDDDSGDDPANTPPPSASKTDEEGDNDNTHDSKKSLLGLDLELAKDETLDDLMYKMYVVNILDKVIAGTDYTAEVVSAATIWKSQYIFLVSVKETERFLTNLKIK